MKFPEHKASLHLTHNQHKAYYQTVEEYTADSGEDWISAEQKGIAIVKDDVWELQWYPHTPVGSYRLLAADLDLLLEAASQVK